MSFREKRAVLGGGVKGLVLDSFEQYKQFLNKFVALSCRFAHVVYMFPWQFQWRSVLGLWKNDKSSGSSKRNFCPGGRPVFFGGRESVLYCVKGVAFYCVGRKACLFALRVSSFIASCESVSVCVSWEWF